MLGKTSRFINSSWTNSYSLNDDNWKINGCPVNGPSIESKGKDVVVAWFSAADGNPQVSLKFSNNQGKSFGEKILINDLNNTPLGRVDLDFIDQKSVVVSWLSTNKGVAPTFTIASVVETNVCPTVITQSPGPIPSAFKAQTKAFVPDPILAQSLAPV